DAVLPERARLVAATAVVDVGHDVGAPRGAGRLAGRALALPVWTGRARHARFAARAAVVEIVHEILPTPPPPVPLTRPPHPLPPRGAAAASPRRTPAGAAAAPRARRAYMAARVAVFRIAGQERAARGAEREPPVARARARFALRAGAARLPAVAAVVGIGLGV